MEMDYATIQNNEGNSLHSSMSSNDSDLEKVLHRKKARIKVIGAGGAGNNTVNRLSEVGIKGCRDCGPEH